MPFTWKISSPPSTWRQKALQIEKLNGRLKISFLWCFVFLLYIPPLTKKVHFSRGGGVYYEKNFALCFGVFRKKQSAIKGIAWIDFPQKLLLSLVAFLGVFFGTQSPLAAIGAGIIAYAIYALVIFHTAKGITEFLSNHLSI